MDKVIIYGLGNNFAFSFHELSRYYEIIAISDSNRSKWGQVYHGYTVSNIISIPDEEYDYIVVTPSCYQEIIDSLEVIGIKKSRIITLQEAYDRIPIKTWIQKKSILNDSKDNRMAYILYGGMGDLLISRVWIEHFIRIYKLDIQKMDLYVSEGNIYDCEYIYSLLSEGITIYSIDALNDNINHYVAVLRFSILPEVLSFDREALSTSDCAISNYIIKLFEYGLSNYNRGLFTAQDFYKTISKEFINKENRLYHTAYDVLGDLYVDNSTGIDLLNNNCNEKEYLIKVGLYKKKYITINTGLNVEYKNKQNTREWDFENWNKLAQLIKTVYPEIEVVQVGVKLREEDDIIADYHLNGETNLKQVAIILKHSFLHLDYDGGLVHVNHMVGGKSLVIMGPSSDKKHAYPENIYIQSEACKECEWTTPDWLSKCPKGYSRPICMNSISVDKVFETFKTYYEHQRW